MRFVGIVCSQSDVSRETAALNSTVQISHFSKQPQFIAQFVSLPWSGAHLQSKKMLWWVGSQQGSVKSSVDTEFTKDKQFAQQFVYKWMEWIVFAFV